MTRDQLYRALVDLCQQYGFTTDHTYDLLHSAVDSIQVGDEEDGKAEAGDVAPADFADTDSLCATIEVDVFRNAGETLSVRQWAERGFEAVRDLEGPIVGLRNQTGAQIDVDLQQGWH